MDALTLFGLSAVSAMLIFYALEDHSPWYILAFAVRAFLRRYMDFCKGLGRLASSKQYGPVLLVAAGKCGCGLQR